MSRVRRPAPLLPCGPGWGTRAEAEEAAGDPGREAFRCLNHACEKWHLRDVPGSRLSLSPDVLVRPRRSTRNPPGITVKTRVLIYERDGYRCACCATSVTGKPHSAGYRKPPAEGGTADPSNLLTFLGTGSGSAGKDDHRWRVEQHPDPLDEQRGLRVRSGQEPTLIPVKTSREDGSWLAEWLTSDGERTTEPPGGSGPLQGWPIQRQAWRDAMRKAQSRLAAEQRRRRMRGTGAGYAPGGRRA
jgi:hypothetical protein